MPCSKYFKDHKNYGVKYSNYIGDGDAKTFKAILDAKPYDDDFTVVKSEYALATLKNDRKPTT